MRLVQMAGVVPSDRAQMAFGYGMFTGGFGLHYGLQRLGCMMIPAGSGNTERHIAMIEDYGTTVLVATPSYALHVCEVGEQHGLRLGEVAASRGTVRRRAVPAGSEGRDRVAHAHRLHRQLRADRGDGPGRIRRMPGQRATCSISPRTTSSGRWSIPIPASPCRTGAMGELVLTPLGKQAIPRAALPHPRPHAGRHRALCLRPHHGAHAEGAQPQRTTCSSFAATNVFPSQVEDVLASIEGVSPHYLIVVENVDGFGHA